MAIKENQYLKTKLTYLQTKSTNCSYNYLVLISLNSYILFELNHERMFLDGGIKTCPTYLTKGPVVGTLN